MRVRLAAVGGFAVAAALAVAAAKPSPDPFYPNPDAPKLTTPQWVGEEGVEAVVLLSIDDMRDTAKYESYLRPILDRLKQIDGRAPLSIFTCEVDPAEPQLQSWLEEGLSIEVHTIKHPCPLLGAGGTLEQARETVHRCIDLLDGIPNMRPVCFRMPCCDSQNSLSPRFFAEIFSKPTPVGNTLKADSSVFTVLTSPDKRFEKYLPKLRGYAGYIEDYPYPYVIGGNCWELPCIVPSDWEAQDRHGVNNPTTVEDLKAALDRVVEMQGVFTFVFHPHGWIENAQVVELIDHAQETHGGKVKFLNMREAVERLEKNAPKPKPRGPDVDGDGQSETLRDGGVFGADGVRWPGEIPDLADPASAGCRFVDLDADGDLDIIVSTPTHQAIYRFESKAIGWLKHSGGERDTVPEARRIPPFVRADGTDNGAWTKRGRVYWQNEGTGRKPAQVEKRTFQELLELDGEPHALLKSRPMTPEESLASVEVAEGYSVDLVAAEPLVRDPIDVTPGEDGRLWVVEMADYPHADCGGRVRWLEDTDGDGVFDRSELFRDGLNFPTGVRPWKDGVLIVAAPDIIYAHGETDELLYTGFREGNQQHRVNGLVPGLDGWLYLANGDSGGTVKSVKTGEVVELGGRDLRIKPETGEIELCSGRTQYGRVRDEWGNWFGCSNSQPLWHFVLPDRYIARNPHAASPSPLRHLWGVGGRPDVFPISHTHERFNDHHTANKITSACGIHVGEGFAYTCEPVHNLVAQLRLTDGGGSFLAKRATPDGTEWFRSKDSWCRPVAVRSDGNGALYIVDMYRHIIEHPEWIPEEWQAKLDLRAGHGRGRIYRVKPMGDIERAPLPDLRVEPDIESVREALADSHPAVRRQAVRVAEQFASGDRLLDQLAPLVRDSDAKVRLQLAFSLGEWTHPRAGELLAELSRNEPEFRYLQAAVVSSAVPHAKALLELQTAVDREKLESTAAAIPGRPAVKVTLAPTAERTDRKNVLTRYRDIDPSTADFQRGAAVFAVHCATCHRYRDHGFEVGPDLAALTDRSTAALLTAILDPNAALEDKYALHTASGDSGAVGSGLLAEETATSVTLLAAGGTKQVLLRTELTELQNTRRSLMTEGLESAIPPAAMADLIAYLQR